MSLLSRALAAGAELASTLKLDGWVNSLIGLGVAYRDKAVHTVFVRPPLLTPQECSDLYHFDDFAAQIVGAVPEDATREGIEVVRTTEQKDDGEDLDVGEAQEDAMRVSDRLNELGALGVTKEAMTWARCVGGGGILGLFEGAGLPNEPLDESRIQRIVKLIQVDRQDLSPERYYVSGPKAGEPERFWLNLVTQSGVQATNTVVHESRIIWFRGASTSRREKLVNGGWDHSVLQRVINILRQVNGGWDSVVNMMYDMSQAAIYINGLIDSLGGEGEEEVQKRIRLINLIRSTTGLLALDAGTKDEPAEKFEVTERASVTGASDLLDRLFVRLAAAARMPVTRLMGQSPAGLNATGDADIRWWYDTIRVSQRLEIRPRYLHLVRWVAIELKLDLEGWDITFPPLWQMTPQEEAALRKSIAETDTLYMDGQVVLPEEITLSRWGSGKYSTEYVVDIEARKAALKATSDPKAGGEQGTVGARAQALLELVEKVTSGAVSRETATVILLKLFAMTEEEANRTLGPEGFKATPKVVPGLPAPVQPKTEPKAPEPPNAKAPGKPAIDPEEDPDGE